MESYELLDKYIGLFKIYTFAHDIIYEYLRHNMMYAMYFDVYSITIIVMTSSSPASIVITLQFTIIVDIICIYIVLILLYAKCRIYYLLDLSSLDRLNIYFWTHSANLSKQYYDI